MFDPDLRGDSDVPAIECDELQAVRSALSALRSSIERGGESDARCAEVEPRSHSDGPRLMHTLLELESLSRCLDALKARTLGRLDASGATEREVGLPTKQWKANRTHGAPGVVGRELRLARALGRFERFAEAMERAAIGSEHVLALANVSNERILPALIELEGDLVTFASRHRFTVFQRHLRNLVALLDQDGSEPDCGERDEARMASDGLGNLLLNVELSGHNAITALRLISAETDRQYRSAVRESESTGAGLPSMAVLRARALMELLRRGSAADPSNPKPAVEAILPVTVDRRGRPTGVHSIDGAPVGDTAAAVLICDAHLRAVVVDSSGTPLRLGRTRRLFSAGQRRALTVRDGGCIFPGCDVPVARCDAHHLVPFGQGGPTDVDQGAMLCRRHHGLVHSSDPWAIELVGIDSLAPDLSTQHRERAVSAGLRPARSVYVWTTPKGTTLLAQNSIDHLGPAPPSRRSAA